MAGKLRHWKEKDGRFFARIAVPARLRPFLDSPRSELIEALGGDRRAAQRAHPAAVARLQQQLAAAERRANAGLNKTTAPIFPLTIEQMAVRHYRKRLLFDDELRNDVRWPKVPIDDLLVSELREAISGRLSDNRLDALTAGWIEEFRLCGNTDVCFPTDEWRRLARALCVAEYEALSRVAERDEGDFTGRPQHPLLEKSDVSTEPLEPVSIRKLWSDYLASRVQAGFIKDGGRRQEPVVRRLRAFLKHDDARRVSRKDLLAWRDHLIGTERLSAKTVNDIYLSTIRSIFAWAHENELLPENVAATVRQPKPRKAHGRERGYTDSEAIAVLQASRTYVPRPNPFGHVSETPHMTAAKQWVPIICAFTGARVSEITQLRKEDLRQESGIWVIRITPDAGSVKTGNWRDVPLHRQIVSCGFVDFVAAAVDGPLFHGASRPERFATAAASVGDALAKWLRRSGIAPDGVQPNHAWRHRLKTVARELGISDRIVDAIQGHAGRTAGDNYGDVTLKAKHAAIEKLPDFDLRA